MNTPDNSGLTAKQLRAAMTYNPETGVFHKPTAAGGRKLLGCVKKDGYVKILAGGKQRAAHRLAWLYVHGDWPTGVIDHINGDRMDNRISNLRDVSIAVNAAHRTKTTAGKSSSRHVGVYFYKNVRRNPWTAQIVIGGKNKYLGKFATEDEAAAARRAAQVALNESA